LGTISNTTKGNIFWFDANDPRIVVITDPSHKLYDRRVDLPIDESMVESIADPNIGILEPVIVRKVGEEYQVVDGRQRVRAARKAAKKYPDRNIRIPSISRTIREYEAAKHATIANVQRTEDSPVVRGTNAKRMMEMGADKDELCSLFGVEWQTIQTWVRVSEKAIEPVQDALNEGKITLSDAVSICKKQHDKQNIALEKALSKGKRKPGHKKGEPKRRKIKIVATEKDGGGFLVNISKCTVDELEEVMYELDAKLERLMRK
jgi:ParB family transcriptional regulator, chromosome partitioning protein